MIIGINGRIGSGKDTVASMIQKTDGYVAGREDMGAGDRWYWYDDAKHWQIKKFAFKLKVIASLLTGIPTGEFESQEVKKRELGSEWGMTVRTLLQRLGTEAIRDGLHVNAWVNALFADYKAGDNWLVTDCRFPNEYDAIKQRGGIVIKVIRPTELPAGYKTLEEYNAQLHPSETSLDNHTFDYVIYNDGTIEELKVKVKEFLIAAKLLTSGH